MAVGTIFVAEGSLVNKVGSQTMRQAVGQIGADLYILGSATDLDDVADFAKALRHSKNGALVKLFKSSFLGHEVNLIYWVDSEEERAKADAKLKEWLAKLQEALVTKLGDWEAKDLG